jgi:hypothetical protein
MIKMIEESSARLLVSASGWKPREDDGRIEAHEDIEEPDNAASLTSSKSFRFHLTRKKFIIVEISALAAAILRWR